MARRFARTLHLALAFPFFAVVTADDARAEDAPPPKGEVALHVRGPDAVPVAGIRLTITDARSDSLEARGPATDTTTDAAGAVRFAWPAGAVQLKISAPQTGYGVTGVFEVVPGQVADAPLPPLAPYARVSGEVPPDVRGEGVQVEFSEQYSREQERSVRFPVDGQGRFAASLRGGLWFVRAVKGRQVLATPGRSLSLAPGQVVSGLQLTKLPPEERAASTQQSAIARVRPQEPQMVWARGVVRDESGAPIAGATVYASAVYHGGIRMYEMAEKAVTDAAGRYAIRGEAGLSMFSATLVAHKAGFVPAMAWISLPDPPFDDVPDGAEAPTTRMATPPAPSEDLVLTRRGGRLEVTVLAEGKPAAGASVALWREGGSLRDTWAAGTDAAAQREVAEIVYPVRTADAAGVARFDSLPPGRYQVIATTGEGVLSYHDDWGWHEPKQPYAVAEGVAVRAGQTTTYRTSIYAPYATVRLRILRHDGTPRTGLVNSESGRLESGAVGYGQWTLDGDGVGEGLLGPPGLYHFAFKYRRSPITRMPVAEPYYSAEATVAVSPLLTARQSLTLTSLRVEPAQVSVQLLDVDGRPARGVVEIGQPVGPPAVLGSTDAAGRVDFQGLPTWTWVAKAHLAGQGEPEIGSYGDAPFPPNAAFRGLNFVPPQPVAAVPNKILQVTLRAVPAGFIRGVIRPPPGHVAAEYEVYAKLTEGENDAVQTRCRPDTGEFLIGPLSAGKVQLQASSGWRADAGTAEVNVVAGQVTAAEIRPAAPASRPANAANSALVGMGGLTEHGVETERLSGRVLLPDGKTPAYGALLAYFPADQPQATLSGITDVFGNVHPRGLWYRPAVAADGEPGSPAGPAIVALLPGSHGATVLAAPPAAGKPLSIVLPQPHTRVGRVTVGGRPPSDLHGQLRVLAAYTGKGKLDGLLSAWCSPQADGSFALSGLTPGTYRVQAALDGIWLSVSATVIVAGGPDAAAAPLEPLRLEIAPPGGAVLVRLVGPDDQPLSNQSVEVDRPEGPLARLWPATFPADGAGQALIPALESGRHVLRVKGTSITRTVFVPPLPEGGPTVVQIRIRPEAK